VTGDLAGLTRGQPRIWVTANRRHKLVAVRTSDAAALEQIERLVIELDRPTPQVLLEMKILEVRLGDSFQSVLDVDFVEGPRQTDLETGKGANPFNPSAADVAQQIAGAGNFPVAGGTLVYQFINDHVRVRLQLLDKNDRLSVLSTPLLLCANDEVARLFVGEERPLVRNFELQTTTTNGVIQNNVVPTVDLRDIGTTLRIVPSINADRSVTLTIVQDVSQVVEGAVDLPVPTGAGVTTFAADTVTTSNLEGTVVAHDGKTLAIGGLIRKSMRDSQEGIPYLMDLPLVGWLFGETVRSEVLTELVLLITPHVLTTPAEGKERSEARLRALSLHPYVDLGDEALNRYDRSSVPGAADYQLLVEDYLMGAPEPIR
jgi:general secretion pathway protein D